MSIEINQDFLEQIKSLTKIKYVKNSMINKPDNQED